MTDLGSGLELGLGVALTNLLNVGFESGAGLVRLRLLIGGVLGGLTA